MPVRLPTAPPAVKYEPTPDYKGFGTEADSMASVTHLQPKAPKADMKKMFK